MVQRSDEEMASLFPMLAGLPMPGPFTVEQNSANSRTETTENVSSTQSPQMQANISFHTIDYGNATDPLTIASQITESLMGALMQGSIGNPNNTNAASNSSTINQQTRIVSLPGPNSPPPLFGVRQSPVIGFGAQRRPFAHTRPSSNASMATFSSTSNNNARGELRGQTERVLSNSISDLIRLTTLSSGEDVVPGIIPSTQLIESESNDFVKNMAAFERAYYLAAIVSRQIRESISSNGTMRWDQLQIMHALLAELPSLCVMQRRLLSGIRSIHSDPGSFELPSHVDVIPWLDRIVVDASSSSDQGSNPPVPNMTLDPSTIVEPPE